GTFPGSGEGRSVVLGKRNRPRGRIFCGPRVPIIKSLGYDRLVLQIGRGKVVPEPFRTESFALDVYRYKDSLKEDLEKADLVISHAGAGSCLETLENRKPLVVVINEKLMNNHQLELAKQLHKDGHLFYCTCRHVGHDYYWIHRYKKNNFQSSLIKEFDFGI
uniref:UDP-N-acetylglucosamine transferase subunit ALG13 n=1 Tax=Felis catus TaxID=9685 RepID=A0ABI7VY40_FELCA